MVYEDQNGVSSPLEISTYVSGLISSITIRNPCGQGAGCPNAHQLKFIISGLRNPRSTKPIPNGFNVNTFTSEGFPID